MSYQPSHADPLTRYVWWLAIACALQCLGQAMVLRLVYVWFRMTGAGVSVAEWVMLGVPAFLILVSLGICGWLVTR